MPFRLGAAAYVESGCPLRTITYREAEPEARDSSHNQFSGDSMRRPLAQLTAAANSRYLLLMALAAMAACGADAVGPESAEFGGKYTLQTLNGRSLPTSMSPPPSCLVGCLGNTSRFAVW